MDNSCPTGSERAESSSVKSKIINFREFKVPISAQTANSALYFVHSMEPIVQSRIAQAFFKISQMSIIKSFGRIKQIKQTRKVVRDVVGSLRKGVALKLKPTAPKIPLNPAKRRERRMRLVGALIKKLSAKRDVAYFKLRNHRIELQVKETRNLQNKEKMKVLLIKSINNTRESLQKCWSRLLQNCNQFAIKHHHQSVLEKNRRILIRSFLKFNSSFIRSAFGKLLSLVRHYQPKQSEHHSSRKEAKINAVKHILAKMIIASQKGKINSAFNAMILHSSNSSLSKSKNHLYTILLSATFSKIHTNSILLRASAFTKLVSLLTKTNNPTSPSKSAKTPSKADKGKISSSSLEAFKSPESADSKPTGAQSRLLTKLYLLRLVTSLRSKIYISIERLRRHGEEVVISSIRQTEKIRFFRRLYAKQVQRVKFALSMLKINSEEIKAHVKKTAYKRLFKWIKLSFRDKLHQSFDIMRNLTLREPEIHKLKFKEKSEKAKASKQANIDSDRNSRANSIAGSINSGRAPSELMMKLRRVKEENIKYLTRLSRENSFMSDDNHKLEFPFEGSRKNSRQINQEHSSRDLSDYNTPLKTITIPQPTTAQNTEVNSKTTELTRRVFALLSAKSARKLLFTFSHLQSFVRQAEKLIEPELNLTLQPSEGISIQPKTSPRRSQPPVFVNFNVDVLPLIEVNKTFKTPQKKQEIISEKRKEALSKSLSKVVDIMGQNCKLREMSSLIQLKNYRKQVATENAEVFTDENVTIPKPIMEDKNEEPKLEDKPPEKQIILVVEKPFKTIAIQSYERSEKLTQTTSSPMTIEPKLKSPPPPPIIEMISIAATTTPTSKPAPILLELTSLETTQVQEPMTKQLAQALVQTEPEPLPELSTSTFGCEVKPIIRPPPQLESVVLDSTEVQKSVVKEFSEGITQTDAESTPVLMVEKFELEVKPLVKPVAELESVAMVSTQVRKGKVKEVAEVNIQTEKESAPQLSTCQFACEIKPTLKPPPLLEESSIPPTNITPIIKPKEVIPPITLNSASILIFDLPAHNKPKPPVPVLDICTAGISSTQILPKPPAPLTTMPLKSVNYEPAPQPQLSFISTKSLKYLPQPKPELQITTIPSKELFLERKVNLSENATTQLQLLPPARAELDVCTIKSCERIPEPRAPLSMSKVGMAGYLPERRELVVSSVGLAEIKPKLKIQPELELSTMNYINVAPAQNTDKKQLAQVGNAIKQISLQAIQPLVRPSKPTSGNQNPPTIFTQPSLTTITIPLFTLPPRRPPQLSQTEPSATLYNSDPVCPVVPDREISSRGQKREIGRSRGGGEKKGLPYGPIVAVTTLYSRRLSSAFSCLLSLPLLSALDLEKKINAIHLDRIQELHKAKAAPQNNRSPLDPPTYPNSLDTSLTMITVNNSQGGSTSSTTLNQHVSKRKDSHVDNGLLLIPEEPESRQGSVQIVNKGNGDDGNGREGIVVERKKEIEGDCYGRDGPKESGEVGYMEEYMEENDGEYGEEGLLAGHYYSENEQLYELPEAPGGEEFQPQPYHADNNSLDHSHDSSDTLQPLHEASPHDSLTTIAAHKISLELSLVHRMKIWRIFNRMDRIIRENIDRRDIEWAYWLIGEVGMEK